jgi:CRP/FNR family transcriptional regulator, cyclic AMP receptor protein
MYLFPHGSHENDMPPTLEHVKSMSAFDADGFLRSAAVGATVATYRPRDIIFSQGDVAESVMYLQEGAVKLSVLSRSGKEAVVAMLETGAFLGESVLTGRPVRLEVATAMTAATVLVVPKQQMIRLLHEQHAFSDRFIAHTLARNIRFEEDLVDHFFNSSDKRLARALLLLTHYGNAGRSHRVPLRLSQQTLAEIVGTTRSRVNMFMNRFKKLGFIEYSGGLKVNDSLVTVILRDECDDGTLAGERDAARQREAPLRA